MSENTTVDPATFALAEGIGWHPTGSAHYPWPHSFWHRLDTSLPDCRPREEDGMCWHSVRPSFGDEQTMPDLKRRAIDLLRSTVVVAS